MSNQLPRAIAWIGGALVAVAALAVALFVGLGLSVGAFFRIQDARTEPDEPQPVKFNSTPPGLPAPNLVAPPTFPKDANKDAPKDAVRDKKD